MLLGRNLVCSELYFRYFQKFGSCLFDKSFNWNLLTWLSFYISCFGFPNEILFLMRCFYKMNEHFFKCFELNFIRFHNFFLLILMLYSKLIIDIIKPTSIKDFQILDLDCWVLLQFLKLF